MDSAASEDTETRCKDEPSLHHRRGVEHRRSQPERLLRNLRQFSFTMASPRKYNVAHRAGGSVTFSATYSTMEILPEFSRR